MNAKWFKVLAIPMVLCMLFAMVGAVSAGQEPQVTICHATEGNHPFNEQTVDANGTAGGHDGHGEDIIPSYSYQVWEVTGSHLECPHNYEEYGNATQCRKWHVWHYEYADKISVDDYGWVTHNYLGKNWDTEGQGIWNNDCEIPTPPRTNTATLAFANNCIGYSASATASVGAVITGNISGTWSDPFILEGPIAAGTVHVTWTEGLPLSIDLPYEAFSEDATCLVTENTFSVEAISGCRGYWQVNHASPGAVITGDFYGPWSDPFTLETAPGGDVTATWTTGLPLSITVPTGTFYEPKECLITQNTLSIELKSNCDGYWVVWTASEGAVITDVGGYGVWTKPYELESAPGGDIVATWTSGLPLSITIPTGTFNEPEGCLQIEPEKPQADVVVEGCGVFPHGVSVPQKVTFTPLWGYFVLPDPYGEIHTKTTIEMAEGSYVWHFIADEGHDLWGKDFYGTVVVGGSCYKEFAKPPCPTCGAPVDETVPDGGCALIKFRFDTPLWILHNWGWYVPIGKAFLCHDANPALLIGDTVYRPVEVASEQPGKWYRLDFKPDEGLGSILIVNSDVPDDLYAQWQSGKMVSADFLYTGPLNKWEACSVLPSGASRVDGKAHMFPGENSWEWAHYMVDFVWGATEAKDGLINYWNAWGEALKWSATMVEIDPVTGHFNYIDQPLPAKPSYLK